MTDQKKDFISFLDYSQEALENILQLTADLKLEWQEKKIKPYLAGKNLAMIWGASGFRNKVSFITGIENMAGKVAEVPGTLDEKEPTEDVAKYLDNWFDGIIARTAKHQQMNRLSETSVNPVINARTDYNHPCEILGDLAYIYGVRGSIEELKVTYVGEANNMCYSWLEAAARLPIKVTIVTPPKFEPKPDQLKKIYAEMAGEISITNDLETGLKNAEVIYTDCWPKHKTIAGAVTIKAAFLPYQINLSNIKLADPSVYFLPCPPVTRGEEISSEVMDQFGDRVFKAKEYLLHAQNAILVTLFG